MSLSVLSFQLYLVFKYSSIGFVLLALYSSPLKCDVIHVLSIRSMALDPLYGGESIGGSGGCSPRLRMPCFEVLVAILSHAMFMRTWACGVLSKILVWEGPFFVSWWPYTCRIRVWYGFLFLMWWIANMMSASALSILPLGSWIG